MRQAERDWKIVNYPTRFELTVGFQASAVFILPSKINSAYPASTLQKRTGFDRIELVCMNMSTIGRLSITDIFPAYSRLPSFG